MKGLQISSKKRAFTLLFFLSFAVTLSAQRVKTKGAGLTPKDTAFYKIERNDPKEVRFLLAGPTLLNLDFAETSLNLRAGGAVFWHKAGWTALGHAHFSLADNMRGAYQGRKSSKPDNLPFVKPTSNRGGHDFGAQLTIPFFKKIVDKKKEVAIGSEHKTEYLINIRHQRLLSWGIAAGAEKIRLIEEFNGTENHAPITSTNLPQDAFLESAAIELDMVKLRFGIERQLTNDLWYQIFNTKFKGKKIKSGVSAWYAHVTYCPQIQLEKGAILTYRADPSSPEQTVPIEIAPENGFAKTGFSLGYRSMSIGKRSGFGFRGEFGARPGLDGEKGTRRYLLMGVQYLFGNAR